MLSIRCLLNCHNWDFVFEKKTVRGYGELYEFGGYYCTRCGVEAGNAKP